MALAGAKEFLATLEDRGRRYVILRSAMNRIQAHAESTTWSGDRMDTDVVAGIEAGLETVLVLTGSTTRAEIELYPFRPGRVADSIADLIDVV